MNRKRFQGPVASARAAGLFLLVSLAPAASAQDGSVAIRAGKIITNAGEVIEDGTIVIDGGRITAVGKDVQVPLLAQPFDGRHLTAFPGWVESIANRGMDRPNENIDVAAFLDVRDSIDPVNFFFEDMLRAGTTTINVQQGSSCVIGGMGHVVKPFGMTVEAMSVMPRAGLVLSASPRSGKSHATQAQGLRRAFSDLRRYLEGIVQEKRDGKDYARREALYQGREPGEGEDPDKGVPMSGKGWIVPGMELVPRWELDEKQAPLLRLVEGKLPAYFYCLSPIEVGTAIEIARDNGFLEQTTFVLGAACWKAADLIAATGRPVILAAELVHTEKDPVTGDQIETFVPGIFHAKEIPFALRSRNSSTQALWYQAARCVAHGLDRQVAIDAATRVPARILGLEKRVGSIEAGKDGNVVLLSGDPLGATTFVEHVFIEGRHVYDRTKDVRVKHLQSGEQPANTTASEQLLESVREDNDDGDAGKDD